MDYLAMPLANAHQKEKFSCGKPLLDEYLHKQAKQDVKRRLAACFILPQGNTIKGYYTLSTSSIEQAKLPANIIKRLPPSYTDLPVTLLGRLAVSTDFQGQGLGETLLMDALKRSYFASLQVGSMAVIVDPIDEQAEKFYEKYDFIKLPDSGKMFLPMATIGQMFP